MGNGISVVFKIYTIAEIMVKIGSEQTPKPIEVKDEKLILKDKANANAKGGIEQNTQPIAKDRIISSESIAGLRKELKDVPEINEALVREVKDQIEKGEYQIDAKAIADKMIESSLADDL
ncbi:MAG: flagellar biosynthesis anti-sigma factor FlgM [SAR324 cluster bacterium]|nr:flagellar biosynthesis anti-sigma factor FlgM [SAR324 cluster bacterium]